MIELKAHVDIDDNVYCSNIWDEYVAVSFGVDRIRMVATRLVTAGQRGIWGGYFAYLAPLGCSFIELDCKKIFPVIDVCDLFLALELALELDTKVFTPGAV